MGQSTATISRMTPSQMRSKCEPRTRKMAATYPVEERIEVLDELLDYAENYRDQLLDENPGLTPARVLGRPVEPRKTRTPSQVRNMLESRQRRFAQSYSAQIQLGAVEDIIIIATDYRNQLAD